MAHCEWTESIPVSHCLDSLRDLSQMPFTFFPYPQIRILKKLIIGIILTNSL